MRPNKVQTSESSGGNESSPNSVRTEHIETSESEEPIDSSGYSAENEDSGERSTSESHENNTPEVSTGVSSTTLTASSGSTVSKMSIYLLDNYPNYNNNISIEFN